MIQAVIFDRDGVLVNSEYTNIRAAELAFADLGVTLTDKEKQSVVGHHPDDYSKPLLRKYGVSYEAFRPRQHDHYYELLPSTPAFERTVQLARDIHRQGIPLAVCTSARSESTLALLETLGIRDLFQAVVGTEDYAHRKPNPEPYLVTAQKLGVDPKYCLVIEDSEVGLKAALAAGMQCIVIYNDYTKDHNFAGARQIVGSARMLTVDDVLS